MQNCTLSCIQIVGELDYSEMCTYVQQQCIQDTLQFIRLYFCGLHMSFMMLIFFGIPLFYLLFKTLNVVTEHYLAPCVETFIQDFKISPSLAGVTFLAFANAAPDVLTSIVAGSSESSSTALIPFGSIFGACLFSSAYIFSCVILLQKDQILTVKIKEIVLPLSFYIFGMLFIIFVTTIYGKMNIYLASVLLLAYLVYIFMVLKAENKEKHKRSLLEGHEDNEQQNENEIQNHYASIENGETNKGEEQKQHKKQQNVIERYMIPPYKPQDFDFVSCLISLTISPLILALTQTVPDIFVAFVGPIPVFLLICLPAILLLSYTIYCKIRKTDPFYFTLFTVYSFLVSIACLTVVCSVLINFMQLIQLLTGINSVFLGLTVFAWANTLGDYLSITHFAKTSNSQTAISGIFSCQLFNFLLGFGISLLIQSANGEYEYKVFDFKGTTYDKISDTIFCIVVFGTLLYHIYNMVIVFHHKGVFMKAQAIKARTYYIGIIILACFFSILTDFFSQITCDL